MAWKPRYWDKLINLSLFLYVHFLVKPEFLRKINKKFSEKFEKESYGHTQIIKNYY